MDAVECIKIVGAATGAGFTLWVLSYRRVSQMVDRVTRLEKDANPDLAAERNRQLGKVVEDVAGYGQRIVVLELTASDGFRRNDETHAKLDGKLDGLREKFDSFISAWGRANGRTP